MSLNSNPSQFPLNPSDLQHIIQIYLAKPVGFVPKCLLKNAPLTLQDTVELLAGKTIATNGECVFNQNDIRAIQYRKEGYSIDMGTLEIIKRLQKYQFHPQYSLFKVLRVKAFALLEANRFKLSQVETVVLPDQPSKVVDISLDKNVSGTLYAVFQEYIRYEYSGNEENLSVAKKYAQNSWNLIANFPEQNNKSIIKLKRYVKFLFDMFCVNTNIMPLLPLNHIHDAVSLIYLSKCNNSEIKSVMKFFKELISSYMENIRFFKEAVQEVSSKLRKNAALRESIRAMNALPDKLSQPLSKLSSLIERVVKPMDALSPNIDEQLTQKLKEIEKLEKAASDLGKAYLENLEIFKTAQKNLEEKTNATHETLIASVHVAWNRGLMQDEMMLQQFFYFHCQGFRKEIESVKKLLDQGKFTLKNEQLASAHFSGRLDAVLAEINEHYMRLDQIVQASAIDDSKKKTIGKNLIDSFDYLLLIVEVIRQTNHQHLHGKLIDGMKIAKEKIKECQTYLGQCLDPQLMKDSSFKESVKTINGFLNKISELFDCTNEKGRCIAFYHALKPSFPNHDVLHEADKLLLDMQHRAFLWRLEHLDLENFAKHILDWKNSTASEVDVEAIYYILHSHFHLLKDAKQILLQLISIPLKTNEDYQVLANLALNIRHFGFIEFLTPWLSLEQASIISAEISALLGNDCEDIQLVFCHLNMFLHRPLISWMYNYELTQSDNNKTPSHVKKSKVSSEKKQVIKKAIKDEEISFEQKDLPLLNSQVMTLPACPPQITLLHDVMRLAISKLSSDVIDPESRPFLNEIQHNLKSYFSILRELFYLSLEEPSFPTEHQKLSKAFLCLEQILKGCILICHKTGKIEEVHHLLKTHDIDLLLKATMVQVPMLKELLMPLKTVVGNWGNIVPVLSRYPNEWKFSRESCQQNALDVLELCLKIVNILPGFPRSSNLSLFELPNRQQVLNHAEGAFQQILSGLKKDVLSIRRTLLQFGELPFNAAEYVQNIAKALNQLETLTCLSAVEIPYAYAEQSMLYASVLLEQSALFLLALSPNTMEGGMHILDKEVVLKEGKRLWRHSHRIHEFIQCLQLQEGIDLKKVEEIAQFLQVTTHYPRATCDTVIAKMLHNIRLWSELKQSLIDEGNFIDSRFVNWSREVLGDDSTSWISTIDEQVLAEIQQLEREYIEIALSISQALLKECSKLLI